MIYDQSGHGNNLSRAQPGEQPSPGPGGVMNLADATLAPVYVDGEKVYGLYSAAGIGYRNNQATGVATGDDPEGIYVVLDETHFNDQCCFDYGNVETSSSGEGPGTMETIYFGNGTDDGWGSGNGPWILSDMSSPKKSKCLLEERQLESSRWASGTQGLNPNDPSITFRFMTTIVKDQLTTFYEGVRPPGYNPMRKRGAIALGVGGDNSNGGAGTFYEGAITIGPLSDATEAQVQADIASVKYSTDPSARGGSSSSGGEAGDGGCDAQ